MTDDQLSTVEIHPEAEHKYSVIWMHGLGADGHDFEGLVPDLHLTARSHIHFISPMPPFKRSPLMAACPCAPGMIF